MYVVTLRAVTDSKRIHLPALDLMPFSSSQDGHYFELTHIVKVDTWETTKQDTYLKRHKHHNLFY